MMEDSLMAVFILVLFLSGIIALYMNPHMVTNPVTKAKVTKDIPRSLKRARKWLIHYPPEMSRYGTRARFVRKLTRAAKDQGLVAYVVDTFYHMMETDNSRKLKLMAVKALIGVNSDVPAVRSKILRLRMKRLDLEIPEILESAQEDILLAEEEEVLALPDNREDLILYADEEEAALAA